MLLCNNHCFEDVQEKESKCFTPFYNIKGVPKNRILTLEANISGLTFTVLRLGLDQGLRTLSVITRHQHWEVREDASPPEGPQEDCSCMGAGTEESDEGESGDQQETSFIKVKKEPLCYV